MKHIFKLFSPSVIRTKRYGNISTGTPNWGKNRDFGQYLALASITAGPSRVVNISTVEYTVGYSTYASSVSRNQQTPPRNTSVNHVYDRKL